jgi:hypothetical protein
MGYRNNENSGGMFSEEAGDRGLGLFEFDEDLPGNFFQSFKDPHAL